MPRWLPRGHTAFMTRSHLTLEEKREEAQKIGTMAVLLEAFCVQETGAKKPQPGEESAPGKAGREEETVQAVLAYGLRCTSLATGAKYLVRLNSEEEEKQDGRGMPRRRRSIQDLFREVCTNLPDSAAAALSGSGRQAEVRMPEGERIILRLDRARAITAQDGTAREYCPPEGGIPHTLLRCGWIALYQKPLLEAGPSASGRGGAQGRIDDAPFEPADHMECRRFSTVNAVLYKKSGPASACADGAAFSQKEDEGPSYYQLMRQTLEEEAARGECNFYRAAAKAAQRVTAAWQAEKAAGREACIGTISVTTWHPEDHITLDLLDRSGRGRGALADFLSQPVFKSAKESTTESTPAFSGAVSPECLLRFLNAKGEICGSWRIRPWNIISPPSSGTDGQDADSEALRRAQYLIQEYIHGLDRTFVTQNRIAAVDILPGRCCRLSKRVLSPQEAVLKPAQLQQMRTLLYLGLTQGYALTKAPRLNVGCSQLFVPRTQADYVTSCCTLRDGAGERNAALLLPDGRLAPSAAYREQEKAELIAMLSLNQVLQAKEDLQRKAGTGEAWETNGIYPVRAEADDSEDFSPRLA